MQIEMTCPGCGKKLRVAAEHAGKAARCPLCNTIYTVPEGNADRAGGFDPSDRWQLKTPEGQVYGPLAREALDHWVREGRVSDDCKIMNEVEGVWRSADEIYPILRPPPKALAQTRIPAWLAPEEPSDDSLSPPRVVNDHRGGMILAVSIVGWAIGCPIFGVLAWIMANSDLRDMQRGVMDPRGVGLTQAGQIIGMIHTLIFLVLIVIAAFVGLASVFI